MSTTSAAKRMAGELRNHGPRALAGAAREGIAWRLRRIWWRSSAKVPGLVALRRSLWRIRKRMLYRRLRASLAHSTLPMADEVLDRLENQLGSERPCRGPASGIAANAPEEPAVAVVVPAFGAAVYLEDCLRSVQLQTYRRWRCYIVDDASTDATSEIAARWERSDPRFRVLRHGANGGLSAARNTGLTHASELLITFLDSDDLLVPTSLARRVEALRRHWNVAHVAGSWSTTPQVPEEARADHGVALDIGEPGDIVDFTSSGGECPFNAHGPLVRTAVLRGLGGFDERMQRGAEDWDMWLRLLRHGYALVPAGGLAGLYRQRRASMVRTDPTGHLREAARLLDSAEIEATVVPSMVVDAAARRPLSELRLAETRLRRAAIYTGMQLAASADTGVLDDSWLADFIRPLPLSTVNRMDLHGAVRSGLHRGLGLGIMASQLNDDQASRVSAIADAVVERLTDAVTGINHQLGVAGGGDDLTGPTHDVLLLAETAADTACLAPLAARLVASGWRVAHLDMETLKGDEGGASAWPAEIPGQPVNHLLLGRVRCDALVHRRPLGPVSRRLLEGLRPSCALIELSDEGRDLELPCSESSGYEPHHRWPASYEPPRRSSVSSIVDERRQWRHLEADAEPARLLLREEGPLEPRSVELLSQLRDRHLGETAVIIGNGPSLNQTPLEKLAGTPTFGVNGIFYAQDRLSEPITYYVVEDTSVFRENTDRIKSFTADWKLFPTIYRPDFDDDEVDDRTVFFRMNAGFYGRRTGSVCHPRFSVDPRQRVFCGQSVTIINLQLAYWMGFRRVVLIGMDFTYTIPDDVEREGDLITSRSDDVNHFHKDYFGKGKSWKDPKLDRVLVNYRLAGEMFAAAGREIVNATVGGNLDVFPRMELVEALHPVR